MPPAPRAIICLTIDTRTVMPRSLNDPECEVPHCLTRTSPRPSACAKRGTGVRCVPPSSIDTMCSRARPGATHSCLPHTPEPHGSSAFGDRQRSANSCFHASADRARSASRSCTTSSKSPHLRAAIDHRLERVRAGTPGDATKRRRERHGQTLACAATGVGRCVGLKSNRPYSSSAITTSSRYAPFAYTVRRRSPSITKPYFS